MQRDEIITREIDRLADVLRASRQYSPEDLVGREGLWTAREKLRMELLVATAEDDQHRVS
jgi:hypothetical protein